MRAVRVILIILLAIGFTGCKRTSNEQRAKALLNEGNRLIAEDSKVTDEWVDVYWKTFNPENRAKFPGNREWLQTRADQLIVLLDESSRLQNEAAEKYERAEALASNDDQRKVIAACVSVMRRTVEINESFKSQMRLVYDQEIKDEKTFNEKFVSLLKQSQQKGKEQDKRWDLLKQMVGRL